VNVQSRRSLDDRLHQAPSHRHDHAVAQGASRTNESDGRARSTLRSSGEAPTPNSIQAHRHQGKDNGVAGDARIIALFMPPRASAKRTDALDGVGARRRSNATTHLRCNARLQLGLRGFWLPAHSPLSLAQPYGATRSIRSAFKTSWKRSFWCVGSIGIPFVTWNLRMGVPVKSKTAIAKFLRAFEGRRAWYRPADANGARGGRRAARPIRADEGLDRVALDEHELASPDVGTGTEQRVAGGEARRSGVSAVALVALRPRGSGGTSGTCRAGRAGRAGRAAFTSRHLAGGEVRRLETAVGDLLARHRVALELSLADAVRGQRDRCPRNAAERDEQGQRRDDLGVGESRSDTASMATLPPWRL
jgi:hypothetical protein